MTYDTQVFEWVKFGAVNADVHVSSLYHFVDQSRNRTVPLQISVELRVKVQV